jgi:hypothetical protein
MRNLICALVLVLSCMGCATLGSLDRSAELMTHQAIVDSETLHNANVLSDAQFKAVNVELNKIAVAGLTFTKLLESGQATPTTACAFLNLVFEEAEILRAAYPNSTVIKNILDDLIKLQDILDKIILKL